jgi:hypothetical protein
MASCAYCGQPTPLHYWDTPVCLKCDALPIEERLRIREAQQAQQQQASQKTDEDTRSQAG